MIIMYALFQKINKLFSINYNKSNYHKNKNIRPKISKQFAGKKLKIYKLRKIYFKLNLMRTSNKMKLLI